MPYNPNEEAGKLLEELMDLAGAPETREGLIVGVDDARAMFEAYLRDAVVAGHMAGSGQVTDLEQELELLKSDLFASEQALAVCEKRDDLAQAALRSIRAMALRGIHESRD